VNVTASPTPAAADQPQRLVIRNTLFVVAAQLVVTPLSIVVNAIVARKLGAAHFGQLYLATSFAALAFLFVEWGHSGALTGSVARDRSRAGLLLGSSMVWRFAAALLTAVLLISACAWLNYERDFLTVLALALLVSLLGTFAFACNDVFRGFERTDFGAITYVSWQALNAAVVIPVMWLGGGLHALLSAQAACAAVGAIGMWFLLKPMGVPRVHASLETIKELTKAGAPFLILGLVITLQTNIDAFLLSKLGSAESVGWHAAARKLIGLLVYPANALIAALYPTLCRLHLQDQHAFRATAASALQLTALAVMPVALSCAFFPDIGVRIFSLDEYGAAADNLRILAAYVLLVYFSMPLSSSLTAAGKQRPWAIAQASCLLLGATLDVLLIPWFQRHYGNGGLGVCVATLSSEVVMVSVGLWLLPPGILNTLLVRKLLAALLGATCMALVAWSLRAFSSFIAAPLALTAYVLGIWAVGGIDSSLLSKGRALLRGQPTA
jgi:O-antigen/teichoic acid export membrane protein